MAKKPKEDFAIEVELKKLNLQQNDLILLRFEKMPDARTIGHIRRNILELINTSYKDLNIRAILLSKNEDLDKISEETLLQLGWIKQEKKLIVEAKTLS